MRNLRCRIIPIGDRHHDSLGQTGKSIRRFWAIYPSVAALVSRRIEIDVAGLVHGSFSRGGVVRPAARNGNFNPGPQAPSVHAVDQSGYVLDEIIQTHRDFRLRCVALLPSLRWCTRCGNYFRIGLSQSITAMNRSAGIDSYLSLDRSLSISDNPRMEIEHAPIYLERLDAGRNMARFYCLSIETDLFGVIVLVRRWGRIGRSGQRMASAHRTLTGAMSEIEQRAIAKRRRGYRNA